MYSNNMKHYFEPQSLILGGGTESIIISTHDCTEQAGLMYVKNEKESLKAGLGEVVHTEQIRIPSHIR